MSRTARIQDYAERARAIRPGTRVQATEEIGGNREVTGYRTIQSGEFGKTVCGLNEDYANDAGYVTVDFDGDFYNVHVDQITTDVEPVCGWCKKPGSRCGCDAGEFE
jgi:hypothetical protein